MNVNVPDYLVEFAQLFRSSDEPCECAPDDNHAINADDWRQIQKIIDAVADGAR